MVEITFEEALRTKCSCILKGKGIKSLDSTNICANFIRDQVPLSFYRINDLIHILFDDLEYIEFWTSIKIYKC